MRDGWYAGTFGDAVQADIRKVDVVPGREYPVIGVLGFGRGLLHRSCTNSETTKYNQLNRILPNQLVYSKLKAFEGAITVAPEGLPQSFASAEFPTYSCRDTILPAYLRLVTQQPDLWRKMSARSKGLGGRRERLHPDDMLSVSLLIPPLVDQRRIIDLIKTVDSAALALSAAIVELAAAQEHLRECPLKAATVPVGQVLEAVESGTSTKPAVGDGPRRKQLTLGAIRPGFFNPTAVKDVGPAQLPEKARLRDGDLLITRSNTPDRVGYVAIATGVALDTYIPDLVWRLVPDEKAVSREFLAEILSSLTMRMKITASASGTSESMRKINKTTFASLRMPLPTLAEQETYLAPLRALRETRTAQDAARQRLVDVRTNVLTALLSGQHEIPHIYDELLAE